MSDDLKEIIEHINESNKDEEVANPVSFNQSVIVIFSFKFHQRKK